MNPAIGMDILKKIRTGEWLGMLGLSGLSVLFLATSWRKWPDSVADFGRELYLPWRLANGAVLYRDAGDIYGPLSKYFNAALFKCFGPGLMVLVKANLVIFVVIVLAIYSLCRRAWGVGAALASTAVFIAVFGFSQFTLVGNYNYATPYTHETTHGFLICLLLVIALVRWVEESTPLRSFLAGSLFGLTAVLKPEIMLAAGLVTSTAAAIQWWLQKPLRMRAIVGWIIGAILPTIGFFVFFSTWLPWEKAFRASCTAWLNVTTTTHFTHDVIQNTFLGIDRPETHVWEHAVATVLACLLIAVIAGAAWLAERSMRRSLRLLLFGTLAGILLWLACFEIAWNEVGRCLLGLLLIYSITSGISLVRRPVIGNTYQAQIIRLLLAVLATALMARMVLNGRIYHYGYYQAALAALIVPAVLIGELPQRLGTGCFGRTIIVVSSLALLVPGVVIVARDSQRVLHLKTLSIGEGADRFYTFPPEIEPTGEIMRLLAESLRKTPHTQTLLVLPEGIMINYLARLPSPAPPSDGREETFIKELQKHPPDWVVIISRDLRGSGVWRYGELPDYGQLILPWVNAHDQPAATVGGDPLDPQQHGGVILKRKVE